MIGTIVLVVVLVTIIFTVGVLVYANMKLQRKCNRLESMIGTPVAIRERYQFKTSQSSVYDELRRISHDLDDAFKEITDLREKCRGPYYPQTFYEQELCRHKKRMNSIENELGDITNHLDHIDSELDAVKDTVGDLKADVDQHSSVIESFDGLYDKVYEIQDDVTRIDNVINKVCSTIDKITEDKNDAGT